MSGETRSIGAVAFSLTLHAAILCALAFSPQNFFDFKSANNQDVEFADAGDNTLNNTDAGTAAEPTAPTAAMEKAPAPTAPVTPPTPQVAAEPPKPAPKVAPAPKAKRAPVVAVAKPAKKASVKATPKEEPSEETAQDDDTKTEAQATESVTTTTPQDPPAETAEDAVAEQQVANDKKVQEESSQKNQPEEKAEAPLAASRAVNPATGSDPAASGGTSSANGSRSYTDLRQQPGNRPPAYPSDARREQRQGTVDLVYYVTPEGSVRDVHLVKSSGSADLDQSAMTAVEKYRYYPGQEGWTEHPVNFVLKGPAQAAPTRLRTSQNTAPTESTN